MSDNHRVFYFGGDPWEHKEDFVKELGLGYTADCYFLVPCATPFIHVVYPYHHIRGKVKELTEEQLTAADDHRQHPHWHMRHRVPIIYNSISRGKTLRADCWVYFGNILADAGPYKGQTSDFVQLGSTRFS